MIDPLERWRELGLPDKPDYAGLLTFGGLPYSQDPTDLEGDDVAIVGAPIDDLTSDRPGTRFGPRAIRAAGCPPGPHLEARLDAMGRAPGDRLRRCACRPLGSGRKPRRDRADGRPGRRGGSDPDRPRWRSLDRGAGREGGGGRSRPGRARPSSTPIPTRAKRSSESRSRTELRCTASSETVTSMAPATCRSACAATGRASRSSRWQAEQGITSFFMHDVRDRGIRGDRRGDDRDRRCRAGLPDRGRRRARPGVRTGDGHARARAG